MSAERALRLKKTKSVLIEKLTEYIEQQEEVEEQLKSASNIDDVVEWQQFHST